MRIRAALILVATLAFALSPLLNPGFGGFEASRLPALQGDPPILPAGWAFAIWGVIYLWLLAMAGFGLWQRAEAADWDASRVPLVASLAVGAAWLPMAQVSPIWATVMIWLMLAAALLAHARTPARDRWLLAAPVGLYAGWLTAASAVALGTTLAGWAVPPLGPQGWAVVCLVVAVAIALVMLGLRPTLTYGAAMAWALVAVTARDGATAVGLLAALAAAVVAATTLWHLRRMGAAR